MARYKHPSRKKRLSKLGRQTKWAPFWTALRVFNKRKVHPSRVNTKKRNWRKTKTKA